MRRSARNNVRLRLYDEMRCDFYFETYSFRLHEQYVQKLSGRVYFERHA